MVMRAGSRCTQGLSGTFSRQWETTFRDSRNPCWLSTYTKSLSTFWVSAAECGSSGDSPHASARNQDHSHRRSIFLPWSPQVCSSSRTWPRKLFKSAASCCRRPTDGGFSFCCVWWRESARTPTFLRSTTPSQPAHWYSILNGLCAYELMNSVRSTAVFV